MTIEAGPDGRKLITVMAGLFENMTRDQLLALDLALDRVNACFKPLELVSRDVRRHCWCPRVP